MGRHQTRRQFCQHPDRAGEGRADPSYQNAVRRINGNLSKDKESDGTAQPPRARPGRSTKAGVLGANIAADLTAWARLLGLYDQEELRDATPDASLPDLEHPGLVCHARKRKISNRTGPGKTRSSPAGTGSAPCPLPADQRRLTLRPERKRIPAVWKPVPPRAHRAVPVPPARTETDMAFKNRLDYET